MHHTFATRLRRLREDAGLSQIELAAGIMSASHLSRLEAGTRSPSREAVRALAARLGVPPEHLVGGPLDTFGRDRQPTTDQRAERLLHNHNFAAAEALASRTLRTSSHAGRRAAALRLRALARVGRGDVAGAILDLEHALRLARHHGERALALRIAVQLRDLREQQRTGRRRPA